MTRSRRRRAARQRSRAKRGRGRRPTSRDAAGACSPGTTAIAASCRGARAPGETPDPYRVWLSEIMLQQTTVKAVAPYYRALPRALADRRALAAAPLEDVLKPVGRARLLRARPQPARLRHRRWSSGMAAAFPRSEAALRALPGIGAYTAAAIAAIAFDAAREPGRRQCRARGGAAVRGRGASCRRPSPTSAALAASAGAGARAPAISRRR